MAKHEATGPDEDVATNAKKTFKFLTTPGLRASATVSRDRDSVAKKVELPRTTRYIVR